MPRFRRKPEVPEAPEVIEARCLDTDPFDSDTYLPAYVRGGGDTLLRVWNHVNQSWIGCEFGDWLRVDNPADVYPIDAATFARTYEPLEEPPDAC